MGTAGSPLLEGTDPLCRLLDNDVSNNLCFQSSDVGLNRNEEAFGLAILFGTISIA